MKAGFVVTTAIAVQILAQVGSLRGQIPAAYRPPHEPAPVVRPPIKVSPRQAPIGPRPAADAAARAARAKQAVSEWKRTIDYSGPRFGFTYLPKAVVDSLKNHNIDVGQTISQFGWQLEHEIHVTPEGPMVLNEWVFLAGGLEKGVFLPSATWLVGARGRSGNEVGFGPNVSVAGVGLALAAGVDVSNGGLHVPMNIAAASSKGGIRVSFLTGFTLH